ncbi:MAG: PEP-utilizing enzyme, partial [Verrucomicrobiota bacterium]
LNRRFHIVQSRPITTIHRAGIEGEWTTADLKDGGVSSGVCSPFMASLYAFAFDRSMGRYLKRVGLHPPLAPASWMSVFYGRPYWNVGAVKMGLRKLPGFVERQFDEDLGVEVAYEGEGHVTRTNPKTVLSGLSVVARLKRAFREQRRSWKTFRQDQRQRLDELAAVDLEAMDRDTGVRFYRRFIDQEYLRSEGAYFVQVYNNSNIITLFNDRIRKYRDRIQFVDLVTGLEDVSHLALNHGLWDLSRKLLADEDALAWWREKTPAELVEAWAKGLTGYRMNEVSRLIETFDYHSTRELDLTVPRFGEDPTFVMESLLANMKLHETADPRSTVEKQRQRYRDKSRVFLDSLSGFERRSMKRALEDIRSFLWWREEYRDLSTRFYFHVRRFTLAMGRLLQDEGGLADRNDIFFLSLDDIYAALEKTIPREEVSRRVERNRTYYRSFHDFFIPHEIGDRYQASTAGPAEASEKRLTGIPCSPGDVVGVVRNIKDVFDADRLEEGDILITRFTDPGWTPKFGLLKAVATETGGVLSHAAVISREYGIPAVLAVPGLTEKLKEGQKVRVDGNRGVVEVLDDAV